MKKVDNVPDEIRLSSTDLFVLSITYAWLRIFPRALLERLRFRPQRLHLAIESRVICCYRLLSAAYIGAALLPSSYGAFITQAQRVNKRNEHGEADAFRTDEMARENSAASNYGISRGELKRLYVRLSEMASDCAGIASYDAVVNCEELVLQDESKFSPSDRETYARGPLHLWDLAKTVSEMGRTDLLFETFSGWVLFLHLKDDIVLGHAIYPPAHRFGNFPIKPAIDVDLLMQAKHISPILLVPQDIQDYVKAMAICRFPGKRFVFVRPPLSGSGLVIPSTLFNSEQRLIGLET